MAAIVAGQRDPLGVRVVGPLRVFGHDDAAHGHAEMAFEKVRGPVANLIHELGSGLEVEQARLLTPQAASSLDAHGNKGGRGLSQDYFLAQSYDRARSLRLAVGPDEVHIAALARSMLKA